MTAVNMLGNIKSVAFACVAGLLALGFRLRMPPPGLIPPDHLRGHPLFFHPNLIPPVMATGLRAHLKELGSIARGGYPINTKDTNFYKTKVKHLLKR